MRVLHINTEEKIGGAARAAHRIHQGLLKAGIDSHMLVMHKESDEDNIWEYSASRNKNVSKIKKRLNSYSDLLWMRLSGVSTRNPWSLNNPIFDSNIVDFVDDFDIINLHWINAGMVDLRMLSQLKKPIVWTMHDMWPFTGGCHYASDGCEKFCNSCSNCSQLKGLGRWDICSNVFRRKKKYYSEDMRIVSPSKWLAREAKRSTLLKNMSIDVIPNCVETEVYSPKDKLLARKILGLSRDSKIILFGAMSATSDPRKGFIYLKKALEILHERENVGELNCPIELLVFGSSSSKENFGFPVHFAGMLHDDISLSLLYSSADVMVVPSHMDNLPNTIMEALSCGTPCVGFNIGGIPDMIKHGETGFLAKPYDEKDLSDCIMSVLEDDERQMKMSQMARKYVLDNFNESKVAGKYIELYQRCLIIN